MIKQVQLHISNCREHYRASMNYIYQISYFRQSTVSLIACAWLYIIQTEKLCVWTLQGSGLQKVNNLSCRGPNEREALAVST